MSLFTIKIENVHIHADDKKLDQILELLINNTLKLKQMEEVLKELKDKLAAQNTALDTVSTNVAGVKKDVDFLKQQLADKDGLTKAEVDELRGVLDGTSAKIDAIGAATASLDAETDSGAAGGGDTGGGENAG